MSLPPDRLELAGLVLTVRQLAIVVRAALQTISETNVVGLSRADDELIQVDDELNQLFVDLTGWTSK